MHIRRAKQLSASSAPSDATRKYSDASRCVFYIADNYASATSFQRKKIPIKAKNGPKTSWFTITPYLCNYETHYSDGTSYSDINWFFPVTPHWFPHYINENQMSCENSVICDWKNQWKIYTFCQKSTGNCLIKHKLFTIHPNLFYRLRSRPLPK